MKKDYKLNINRDYQPPSSEKIAEKQNFAALLQRFEQETPVAETSPPRKPLRLVPWVTGLAVAAALLGWFFYVNTGLTPVEYQKQENAHFAAQPFINPPFPDIPAAQFASAKVNANEGGVYEHRTGSRIVFPKSAFVDDKGAPVEGDVDIRYREFHDYVDFFLSGIPMTYDSAGVQYTLESAGMLEVYAEQNGKRVRIAPGKELDVELVSHINVEDINVPPAYNIYKLDTEARNWVYTEPDNYEMLTEDDLNNLDPDDPATPIKQELRKVLQEISELEASETARIENSVSALTAPTKPQRTNGSSSVFDLDFADNPAMAELYKNSLWQVSPRSAVSADRIMRNPQDVELEKVSDTEFEITFIDGEQRQIVLVNPVLTGKDYDNAMAIYEEKAAEYERLRAERAAQLAEQKAALEARLAADRLAANKSYEQAMTDLRAAGSNAAATDLMLRRKIVNRFRVTSFGIWNCDRPLPPDIHLLSASFETDKGRKINNMTAYMVDKSQNTVNRFLATDDAYMSFNRNSEHLLWVVTPDNTIAVFRSEDFAKIPEGDKDFTFTLQDTGRKAENEEDVREILYF